MRDMLVNVLIVIIFIFLLNPTSYFYKGERIASDEQKKKAINLDGEDKVAMYLQNIVDTYGGFLMNNFCFESKEGCSTEIDHILISQGGVFVIETKAYRGIIIGNEDDEEWICEKRKLQNDKRFRNPIIQNKMHIHQLKRMLKDKAPKMYSIVIFVNADITNVDSDYVYSIKAAVDTIKDMMENEEYTEEYIHILYESFEELFEKHGISHEQHVNNIRRVYR